MNNPIIYMQENCEEVQLHLEQGGCKVCSLDELDLSKRYTLFISGQLTREFALDIPGNLSYEKAQKAAQFELEEQLLENISQVHAVLYKHDSRYRATLISNMDFQSLLQPFKDKNIQLLNVFPDYLLLPFEADGISISIMNSQATVRLNEVCGFNCDITVLETVLRQKCLSESIRNIKIYLYAQDQDVLPSGLALEEVEYRESIDSLLDNPPNQPNDEQNLLQGRYAKKVNDFSAKWAPWALASGLALWFSLWIAQDIWRIRYYQTELAVLDVEIENLYKKAYPNAKSVISPVARIENDLKTRGPLAKSPSVLRVLSKISQAFELTDNSIDGLEFNEDKFSVNFQVQDVDALQRLKKALTNVNLKVSNENTEVGSGKVATKFTVSEI